MLQQFKFRAAQWLSREPIDWPSVGVISTSCAIIGLAIVGLWMELAR